MPNEIELMDEVQVPVTVIAPVADSILQKMIDGEPPYETVCLSVDLDQLHLDIDAELSVPVRIRGEAHDADAQHWFDISIEAKKRAELFPRFAGRFFANPDGPSKAELWLRGSYEPPLAHIGQQLNASLLQGIAEQSLQQFLDRVTTDALERANAAEREIARAHFHPE